MLHSRMFWKIFAGLACAGLVLAGISLGMSRQISLPWLYVDITLASLGTAFLLARWLYNSWSEISALARQIINEPLGITAAGTSDLPPLSSADDERLQVSTALLRLQAGRQDEHARLERQQQDWKNLLDKLTEGVVLLGLGRQVLAHNSAAAKILQPAGTAPLVGLVLSPGHNGQALLADLIQQGYATSQNVHRRLEWSGEHPGLRLDVQFLWLGGRGEQELQAALVLNQVLPQETDTRLRSDFVANASHELRTPIASIKAAVQTLRDGAALPGPGERFVAMIDRNVQRLEALTTDLLDLSHVESQDARLAPAQLDLGCFWLQLQQMFEQRLQEKNIQLTFHSEIDSVWVDSRLLFVVIRNLVDNSIKFVTENTGLIQVSVTWAQEGVVLTVEDNGCGIPPEDQPRVFERFYQVDKSRSGNTGTGLGLSIAKHATAAMGGTIHLTSTPEKGTTVRVSLPRALHNAAG